MRTDEDLRRELDNVTPLRPAARKAKAPKADARGAGGAKPAWAAELIRGDRGPLAVEANVALMLRLDPALAGALRFNELVQGVECTGLPWRPGDGWRAWGDVDDIALAVWCQHREVPAKPGTCAAAVQLVAHDHPHHPVRAYLDGLPAWDGTPRLDGWLRTHLGAEPSGDDDAALAGSAAYLRDVGRKWMIGGVARAYDPGCKFDTVLILEGRQGLKKSSALATTMPDPTWFADEIADLGTKDSAQDLRGKWLIELGELAAMRKVEVERVKGFVSRRVDHYRPSYGRRSQDFPRGCFFGGTTNSDAYLQDDENRRFWPARVGRIDLDALRRDRDQLWAEALAAYRAGETWWLEGAVERAAVREQAERRTVDPWEGMILDWAAVQVEPVTIPDVLARLEVPVERQDQTTANRIARIFRAAGWEKAQRREGGRRIWVYRKPSQVEEPSQVDGEQPVTANPSASAAVTGVTGVIGTQAHVYTRPPEGSTDSGVTPMTPVTPVTAERPLACPDPRDEEGWLAELRGCRSVEDRNGVIGRWAVAVGGRRGARGEVPVAELPRSLAAPTMEALARRYGWETRRIEPAHGGGLP